MSRSAASTTSWRIPEPLRLTQTRLDFHSPNSTPPAPVSLTRTTNKRAAARRTRRDSPASKKLKQTLLSFRSLPSSTIITSDSSSDEDEGKNVCPPRTATLLVRKSARIAKRRERVANGQETRSHNHYARPRPPLAPPAPPIVVTARTPHENRITIDLTGVRDEEHYELLGNLEYFGLKGRELQKANEEAERVALASRVIKVDETYSLDEFESLCRHVERNIIGFSLAEIEHSPLISRANNFIDKYDSAFQGRAQYGRTMHLSGERMFREIGKLTKDMVFCDIGHGIGNLVFQSAFTIGCESRGIELIKERYDISNTLRWGVSLGHTLSANERGIEQFVGKIDLRYGGLEDKKHREFLTKDVDLMYCNNYNEVFAVRSDMKGKDHFVPDDFLGGLLTQLKPGAKLITLSALCHLPPPLDKANEIRKDKQLPEHANASFYHYEEVKEDGGEGHLNFTANPFRYYVYTRVGDASFLCDNPRCERARDMIPIPAWTMHKEGKCDEKLVPSMGCPDCGRSARSTRQKRRIDYKSLSQPK